MVASTIGARDSWSEFPTFGSENHVFSIDFFGFQLEINLISTWIGPSFFQKFDELLKRKVVIWLILPVAYAYLGD